MGSVIKLTCFLLVAVICEGANLQKVKKDQWLFDFSCYDLNNHGYVGDIPHPTDCSSYLTCTVAHNGFHGATVRPCADGLQFHMDKCTCDWPDSAKCFESGNDEHEANRFNCATQLTGHAG